jgi:aspartyl-tRNA(Asn)/glutamyl-tRNA(Gln) amidotransferase subunit C
MAISKDDLEHVVRLARLDLADAEKDKYTQDLGEILSYADELNQTSTSGLEVVSQIAGLSSIARADEITNTNIREKLLENAPAQQDGFIKVKKVFE